MSHRRPYPDHGNNLPTNHNVRFSREIRSSSLQTREPSDPDPRDLYGHFIPRETIPPVNRGRDPQQDLSVAFRIDPRDVSSGGSHSERGRGYHRRSANNSGDRTPHGNWRLPRTDLYEPSGQGGQFVGRSNHQQGNRLPYSRGKSVTKECLATPEVDSSYIHSPQLENRGLRQQVGTSHVRGRGKSEKKRSQATGGQNQGEGGQHQGRKGQDSEETTETSKHSFSHLCHYCGNEILREENVRTEKGKTYHEQCFSVHIPRCKRACDEFRDLYAVNPHVLWMGIHVTYLYGQDTQDKNKRKKRAIKAEELLKYVSAVRNSNSGYILIHLVGLAPEDNFTGAFDEFADVKLQGLINDGSSFVDVYQKELLSSKEELEEFTDILVLFVKGADILVTADLKTKSALDDCIIDTPESNLLKFVQDRHCFKETHHIIPTDKEGRLNVFQESRHIQTKACFQPSVRADKLVRSIFDKLNLAEYISALSKNEDGGSCLFGITEEVRKFKEEGYNSKRLVVEPVVIHGQSEVEELIKKEVHQTVLVCDYDGKEKANTDLIKVSFKPPNAFNLPRTDKEGFVVHVSVRSVSGVVFYVKDGPVAYTCSVDKGTSPITRVTIGEWFQAFQRRSQPIN